MIVPMKKVSLIVLDSERKNALKKLRRLGLLHIEIKEGKGSRLLELKEQIASLEKGRFAVAETVRGCGQSDQGYGSERGGHPGGAYHSRKD